LLTSLSEPQQTLTPSHATHHLQNKLRSAQRRCTAHPNIAPCSSPPPSVPCGAHLPPLCPPPPPCPIGSPLTSTPARLTYFHYRLVKDTPTLRHTEKDAHHSPSHAIDSSTPAKDKEKARRGEERCEGDEVRDRTISYAGALRKLTSSRIDDATRKLPLCAAANENSWRLRGEKRKRRVQGSVQWSAAGVLCRDTGLRSTTRKTRTYTLGSQRLNSTCSRAPCCASWKSEPCVI
jgi:hypothetical protein